MTEAEAAQLMQEFYVLYFVVLPAIVGVGGLIVIVSDWWTERKRRQRIREIISRKRT